MMRRLSRNRPRDIKMHELPVVQDLIKTLDKESEERRIKKITEINLVIGELSGIIGECVQTYFDLLSEGHTCERAKLNFTFLPSTLICSECGTEFPHEKSFDCPLCGAQGRLKKGSGREFYVRSIEAT